MKRAIKNKYDLLPPSPFTPYKTSPRNVESRAPDQVKTQMDRLAFGCGPEKHLLNYVLKTMVSTGATSNVYLLERISPEMTSGSDINSNRFEVDVMSCTKLDGELGASQSVMLDTLPHLIAYKHFVHKSEDLILRSFDQSRKRELELIQILSHENIIKPLYLVVDTFRVETDQECCGYSMRAGISMENLMPPSLSEMYHAAISISKALSYLHSLQIVFMDLKPANLVWIDSDSGGKPILQLIDFGACLYRSELCSSQKSEGCEKPCKCDAVITPLYTSSEYWSHNYCVSYPHDIWTLGILLSQLIYDAHPYIAGRWGERSISHSNLAERPIIGIEGASRSIEILAHQYKNQLSPNLKETSWYQRVMRVVSQEVRTPQTPEQLIYRLVQHEPLKRPTAEQLIAELQLLHSQLK